MRDSRLSDVEDAEAASVDSVRWRYDWRPWLTSRFSTNSSVNAVRIAQELGVDFEEVNYIKEPLDAETLRAIIAKLEDPSTNLVRRDSMFKKLALTDGDVKTDDQIIDVLVRHKQLLQRPLVVTKERAIIGRPKDRVRTLLG